jgi:hypothetical protein
MEDSEITGCRTAGLVVGEEGASPAHADVKRSQFARNSTGIGIFAGGSADITDSECRENNEGIVVMGRGSRVQITKTALLANRDHGLYVYGEAEANGVDLNIQGNARGAQSGMPRKGSTGGSLALQDCHVTSNQVFGVGAYAKSQLTLTRVTFEANGKTNIYREGGAIVQTEGVPDGSPGQATTTATPEKDGTESHKSAKSFKKQRRQSDDDARRIMRRFFRP